MKANEFVKKFGWDFAIQLSEMNPHRRESSNDDELSTSDLKPYVDAYELVQSYGGLEKSKKLVERTVFPLSDYIISLKQAIADVESCQ